MVDTSGFFGSLFRVCHIIMRLIYLNMLWLLFSVGGLVIFGIFPATIALFTVLKKIKDGEEFSVLRVFWYAVKKNIIKGNILGYVVMLLGALLFVDILFFEMLEQTLFIGIAYFLKVIFFLFVLMALYVFPVYISFDLNPIQAIKNSLLIGAANPLYTLFMLILSIIIITFLLLFPRLIPIISVSLLSYTWVFFADKAICRIQKYKTVTKIS